MWWISYINNYFPYMYGLFELEVAAKRFKQQYLINNMKGEMRKRYIEYCKKNAIFYIESELTEIMLFHIEEEYGEILIERFKRYRKNKAVRDVVDIANEIKSKYLN